MRKKISLQLFFFCKSKSALKLIQLYHLLETLKHVLLLLFNAQIRMAVFQLKLRLQIRKCPLAFFNKAFNLPSDKGDSNPIT